MSTMTMDDLEAAEVGSVMSIRDSVTSTEAVLWKRTETGWETDSGVTLDISRFAGDVGRGRVFRDVPKQVGQVWWDGLSYNYGYLLVKPSTLANHWWVLRMTFAADGDATTPRLDRLVRLADRNLTTSAVRTDAPTWLSTVAPVLSRWADREESLPAMVEAHDKLDADLRALRRSVDSREQVAEYQRNVAETLTAAVAEPIEPSRLRTMLREAGIPVTGPQVEVPVTLVVQGASAVALSTNTITAALPDGVTATGSTITPMVTWDVTLTTKRTVEEGQCACSLVTRTEVRRLIRERGIEPSSFTVRESTCPAPIHS